MEQAVAAALESPRGTPADGFTKKRPAPNAQQGDSSPKSAREAVTEHGDAWWAYCDEGFVKALSKDVAREQIERERDARKMYWCEKGIDPRVDHRDLLGLA